MRYLEKLINQCPQVTETADFILPEFIKAILRKIIFEEKFPLAEPVKVKVNDVEALFIVENPSDWYRLARGNFETGFAEELLSVINPGDIFLDVGAAQGLYSLLAAKAGAEVYAVDPDPLSITSLKKNLSLNLQVESKLHILELAVAAKEGILEFNYDPKGVQAGSLKRVNRELQVKVLIPTTTIDTLVRSQTIKPPTVIKIDVEGAEGLVLEGMRGYLNSWERPQHLFIEFHPRFLPRFGSSIEAVQAFIAQQGYKPNNQTHFHRDKHLEHFIPVY